MPGLVAKAGPVLSGELSNHPHDFKPQALAQFGTVGCAKTDHRNCVSTHRTA